MYCPKCGTQNQDTAMFCSSCGTPLTPAAAAAAPSAQAPVGSKNAVVAAIANLFWGIGYLYLGYKKVIGIPTFAFVVLIFVVSVVVGIFTVGLLSFLIAIVLAIDGYQKGTGQKGFIGAQK